MKSVYDMELVLVRPKYKQVNKYTRAGKNGKTIVCPECDNEALVYHFSWSALTCQSCRQMINKGDWLLND